MAQASLSGCCRRGKLFAPEPDEEILDPLDVGVADDLACRDAALDFSLDLRLKRSATWMKR